MTYTWLVSITWEGGKGGNISYSGGITDYDYYDDDDYYDYDYDYRDEILQWSGSAWVEVGRMKMARGFHAVSSIRLDDEVLQFCA